MSIALQSISRHNLLDTLRRSEHGPHQPSADTRLVLREPTLSTENNKDLIRGSPIQNKNNSL